MFRTKQLPQILEYATNDFLYSDIKQIRLAKKIQIYIDTIDGKKYSCFFMDHEYRDQLIKALQFYLKDRFIVV